MAERAAYLVDEVLPRVPGRQWVLTLPYRLRYASARSSSWAGAPWLACSVVSCRWRSSAVISEVPSPSPRKNFGS